MMTRAQALAIAERAQVPIALDFHRLRSSQVAALLVEADARRYRAPRNANGSRGRMFWQYVQRAAWVKP